MLLTRPECDEGWITWFAALVNVPMVVFVAGYNLWDEMSPLETVRVWTSCAQPELQRVEFWGSARHVHYRDNGLVRAVWPWPRSTVQFAMVKTKVGQWAMLERGARMHSGPHAKMESCMCDDESIMPPPQMSSRRRYDQYGQLG